ncbi:serine/threonine protein phosphatase 7 long form [Trifolium pratense]|uniref:Serine/threonine protein phosphatase 7 long form n=1 Tax=Trifolium pratense TaxID=57577 RepID=A0A2K3K3H7_TRIPR|nr:serine/threonine protein phosphatase 7 long form [Trifolium pratense]
MLFLLLKPEVVAFTERWHPETGTFHLPIGGMTITLDDVSCLLHIPISGNMLNHLGTTCSMDEWEDMCEEHLNFPRDACRREFATNERCTYWVSQMALRPIRDTFHGLIESHIRRYGHQLKGIRQDLQMLKC